MVPFVSLHVFADDASRLLEARKAVSAIPPQFVQVLPGEISIGEPQSAISICREKAPQTAKAASKQASRAIRHASLRNRNSNGIPGARERANPEHFDWRAAAGKRPAMPEKDEFASNWGRKESPGLKTLRVQQISTPCHGVPEQLKPEVKPPLQTRCPIDNGAGYAVGQTRAVMTIREAL